MIYQGIFEDVNGNNHLLRIGTTGEVQTLKFGGSPFVTTMDESDSSIYIPVKCQAGTIGLVAVDTEYMFGLYTGDAHGMPVTLYRGEVVNPATIEWVGYITPSLYDIGYTKYLEELDVDCVDGLATLEQYKYKPIGNNAGIVTLIDLVRHCIAKCGCYTMMVMSTNTRLSDTDTRDLWQSCSISERNFMSQDSAATDGEDDKTYKEVLEAVCQWMGVTAIAKGDTVYFVDYDALPDATANTCIIVSVANGTVTTGSMAAQAYTIDGGSYAESGAKLSLDNVYTKVTVTCDLNEYDDVLGDLFDGVENITADDPDLKNGPLPTSLLPRGGGYLQPGTGDNMLYACLKAADMWSAVWLKYYKSPFITLHHYTTASGNPSTSAYDNSVNYTNTKSIDGAFMVRAAVQELSMTDPWSFDEYTLVDIHTYDGLMMANDIHSVSFDDYFFLINHSTNHIANSAQANKPFFATGDNLPATALFGGINARLVISGEVMYHIWDDHMYPLPKDDKNGPDPDDGSKTCPAGDGYLLCQLKWGNLYWTGRAWRSSASTFRLPFLLKSDRYDAVIFTSHSINNSVSWKLGTDADGYAIPMPHDSILFGLPKLTIYKPTDMGSYNYPRFMALKNLRLTPVVANPTFSEDMDDDTVYTNIIDTRNATEMDEVTMTVCTWDNKKPNFSAVAYTDAQDSAQMHFVDTTYNTALSADEVGSTRHDGTISDGNMRQEEHLVYRLTNQYSEPAKVLNVCLHDAVSPAQMVSESNLATSFIVDKVDVDYKQQKYTYKLIEKK